ncbi:MAG: cytochrome c oxidase subunit 3 [Gammaproteobacteria bacterium]|nr:cytochrome c oxidase subunit 3 [Gammaproteobacteria bacterium]MCP4881906.1 cytochrome c oxidase subunit 3 [Gammaproteobacteria bacterium]
MAASNYYVPESSRLPIGTSIGLIGLAAGAGGMLNHSSSGGEGWALPHFVFFAGALILASVLYNWFSKVIGESRGGLYNAQMDRSYRWGMGWFIFSEVMFFAAFFGALFYVRQIAGPWLSGEGDKGISHMLWPEFVFQWPMFNNPAGADLPGPEAVIDPWHIPLLNTVLLISSSVTVTFAHHALRAMDRTRVIFWLALTVILGAVFVYFQIVEYVEAYEELGLTLDSGIYGSTFFMLTGFHGAHVTIGAFILFVIWLRIIKGHFTPEQHFGFEAAAWYWHFVDMVWIGLFFFVYIL